MVFAVWDYQNNDSVRNATNNSLTALNDRISQMLSTGNLNPPKLGDSDPNTVKNAIKPETDDSNAQKNAAGLVPMLLYTSILRMTFNYDLPQSMQ